jgi:two-component system response regulator AtoC
MSQLLSYHWPGNVRELENAIERAVVLADGSVLLPENFSPEFAQSHRTGHTNGLIEGFSLKQAQRVLEKKLITNALKETGGNRTQAARLLEISHPSLLSKIKAYNISL